MFGSWGECPVNGHLAANVVEANRIEGVQAIGRQAEHSAEAVCRVAYASLTEYLDAVTEAGICLARQRSVWAGRRLHHLEPTRLHEATTDWRIDLIHYRRSLVMDGNTPWSPFA
jgi:hypothetical protein